MAIGKRIRFFRKRKNMTQKQFGEILGFLGKTSDVRIAQYESEARTPKQDLINKMAHILDISPYAITVPEIDSYTGLMHTLFTLEDMYGLTINELDGELCLHLDKHSKEYSNMFNLFNAWQQQSNKLKYDEITKEEYDQWRYNYPESDTSQRKAKPVSQELSDFIVSALNDK